MGAGKSSFIRSLMTSKDSTELLAGDNIPLIKGGAKSCTLEPKLYKVHPSHDIGGDGKPIYVLDTEGLNSQTVTLILE